MGYKEDLAYGPMPSPCNLGGFGIDSFLMEFVGLLLRTRISRAT